MDASHRVITQGERDWCCRGTLALKRAGSRSPKFHIEVEFGYHAGSMMQPPWQIPQGNDYVLETRGVTLEYPGAVAPRMQQSRHQQLPR